MILKSKITFAALLIMLVIIASCYKKSDTIALIQQPNPANNMAYLKFINVYTAPTPSAATPAAGPSVNIFVNDVKINGAAIGYGGAFPLSPAYAAVKPALASNIKIILNRTTGAALAGDTLVNKTYNLGANSYTTVYLTDTLLNPTPFSPYFLPIAELVTEAKVGFFKARFVNMIPSVDTLEVFSKRLNAVMFTGILYKNAAEQVELPTYLISDTLQLRKVSAPATVLATFSGFFPTASRVYTFYCTGNITGAPKARVLTSYTNR
jgi:hypothetical protein